MKKLIITTCVVLSMAMFPMSNVSAGCNYNEQQEQWVGNCPSNSYNGYSVNRIRNRNINNNSNTNRNNNTNVQGQMQGQIQGQQQSIGDVGSSSSVGDITVNVNGSEQQKEPTTINNNINVEDSGSRGIESATVNMRGVRGFATPVETHYPNAPTYSGPARKDSNVQDVKTMTMYKDTFTRAEVEEALGVVSIDRHTTGEEESDSYWGSNKKDSNQTIKIVMSAPARNMVVQTALITVKAKNADTESKDVLYAALLRGLDTGADLLLITDEGAGTIMKSFGWGIGMSYNRSTLSADESTGGVSSGGLGISGGKAGYKSLPWIQAIGLKYR